MEDLPELVQYFIDHHPHLTAQPIHELTSKFWRRLLEHDWPGNVRELFHILSYAISVSQNGILDERDFPSYFLRHSAPLERKETGREEMDPVPAAVGRTFAEQMDDFERNLFLEYLSILREKRNKSSGGPRSYAAKFPVSYEEVPGNGKRG